MRLFFFGLFLFFNVGSVFANPGILSVSDVRAYQEVFDLQRDGRFKSADNVLKTIKNPILTGYVLYDRYFSPHYITQKKEITAWLKKYGDLSVATDIYDLSKQKKAKAPDGRPKGLFGGNSGTCSAVFRPEPIDLIANKKFSYLSESRRKQAKEIMKKIHRHINNGKTLSARKLVESKEAKNLFSYYDHDSARTALAFSYFIDGEDELAMSFISQALQHSGDEIPLAWWVAGLVSWRQGHYAQAAEYFSSAAVHKKRYPILEAASSVWAARSYLKSGRYEQVAPYLERAAKHQRLFYGILAMRLLSMDLTHLWETPIMPSDEVRADFSHPALNRFYALQQIGQQDLAERELSKLYLEADSEAKGILLMISQENGFSDDLLAITGNLTDGNSRYPAPNWVPTDGWKVDKALVYAFVRQESCFNKRAESKVGALGLMQIMPDTAREMAENMQYPWQKQLLKEPEYNLSLGQNYLLKLMKMPAVGDNLMFIAVAYNAGPGNLIKWKSKMECNDPLLFLESIPSRETRSFVERIIVNYWIYRNLLQQPLASLDIVAHGQWPSYKNLECD